MWDDEAGYDLEDPKHPTWADRYADHADMQRKRMREDPDYGAWVRARESLSEPRGDFPPEYCDATGDPRCAGEADVRSPSGTFLGSESEEVEGHSR